MEQDTASRSPPGDLSGRLEPAPQRRAFWLRVGDNRIASDFLALAASTALFQSANLIVQLLLARTLGPAGYGDWSLLIVVATYLSYLQFGVSNAMNRDIPLYTGAGDATRVVTIQRVALGGTIGGAALGVLVLLLLPQAWVSRNGGTGVLAGTAGYIIATQAWTYVATYLQATQRFDRFSLLQAGLGVLTCAITVPAGLRWGVPGAMAGQAIALGVAAAAGWGMAGLRTRPSFRWGEWLRLVAVGLPIMLVGIGYVFLTTIDRWVVLRYLGTAAVGQYSFQTRLVSVSVLLCGLVANLMYPRMAETWGRTRDVRQLWALIRQQVLMSLGLTAVAGAAMLLLLPWAIPRLWPAYTPSLAFLPILVLGMTFLPLCAVFGVVLNVVGRQGPYLLVQIVMLGIGAALSIGITRATHSLTGTAAAAATTYGLYLLLLAVVSAIVLRRMAGRVAD
jgi:O-antigen/teichoic acid export membrane protein